MERLSAEQQQTVAAALRLWRSHFQVPPRCRRALLWHLRVWRSQPWQDSADVASAAWRSFTAQNCSRRT
ncbi:hypothetical protein CHLRE_05g238353v5 [Chlamydomonas reinhardtii]|uniref:Uncharacterized protein n=1 Tax=Chlamydomonas reinhardtii TaxID=3055 RepID=A0A2K3DSZ9_CHLRE|nr:uncharacterized protein CHLRE_05g238353v5 [Chlamydomonas reinhardtii]PNW83662.1 hypothetical protein CHLRE_05g238353v5 [Chlamydomonas reinhardtii]